MRENIIHIMAQHNLDALDKKILRLIADDARMPFLEVARACNVSGAAIHQRIQKLTNLGVLKGSQFIIDPEKIGYETCAYIGLFLKDPGQFDFVLEELKKIRYPGGLILHGVHDPGDFPKCVLLMKEAMEKTGT